MDIGGAQKVEHPANLKAALALFGDRQAVLGERSGSLGVSGNNK
jgi:hypothetical protein